MDVQVTFDCADPDRLARFWAALLGYELQPPPEGFDSWDAWLEKANIPKENWGDAAAIVDPEKKGPRFFFQRVPEPKSAKNRVHLDVNPNLPWDLPPAERRAGLEEAATRAEGLGAEELWRKEEYGQFWITMTDPEGNEFCLH